MRGRRPKASGYALVALLVTLTIMLVAMSAAVPTWRYLVKNDREQELIFRGSEIAKAVARYQQRNGNALPPSLEILVKGKYLRHAYKDPMSKDGRWRFIRPGEMLLPGQNPLQRGPGSTSSTTTTTTRPSAFSPAGTIMGGFLGVASSSKEKGLRLVNGRSRYDEWVFAPNQPCIIGMPTGLTTGPPGNPGASAMVRALPPSAQARTPQVAPCGEEEVVPP